MCQVRVTLVVIPHRDGVQLRRVEKLGDVPARSEHASLRLKPHQLLQRREDGAVMKRLDVFHDLRRIRMAEDLHLLDAGRVVQKVAEQGVVDVILSGD